MKCYMFYTCIAVFILSGCSCAKRNSVMQNEIALKLENKSFTFEMNHVYPQNMRSQLLTPGYELAVRNDSAFAFLPYFGMSYSGNIDPDNAGVKFAEPVIDYQIVKSKSSGWVISFSIRCRQVIYHLKAFVSKSGFVNLSVQTLSLDYIYYRGEIR